VNVAVEEFPAVGVNPLAPQEIKLVPGAFLNTHVTVAPGVTPEEDVPGGFGVQAATLAGRLIVYEKVSWFITLCASLHSTVMLPDPG